VKKKKPYNQAKAGKTSYVGRNHKNHFQVSRAELKPHLQRIFIMMIPKEFDWWHIHLEGRSDQEIQKDTGATIE